MGMRVGSYGYEGWLIWDEGGLIWYEGGLIG
jgi:hypothetical protein